MTPADRQDYLDYVEGHLLDAQEQADWEASRNVDLGLDCGWVTQADMDAMLARYRAEANSTLDGRGWRRYSLPDELRGEGEAA